MRKALPVTGKRSAFLPAKRFAENRLGFVWRINVQVAEVGVRAECFPQRTAQLWASLFCQAAKLILPLVEACGISHFSLLGRKTDGSGMISCEVGYRPQNGMYAISLGIQRFITQKSFQHNFTERNEANHGDSDGNHHDDDQF